MVLDWCYMCKCSWEPVDHLLLHCPIARELWTMLVGLFGIYWVMPMSVLGLMDCWQGNLGGHRNIDIWRVVAHCLMWCIWRECDARSFEDYESTIVELKLLFFRTLFDSVSSRGSFSFMSLLDLLDFYF